MKAFAGTPGGGVDGAAITELPTPEPPPGSLRVAVAAAALNPADLKVLHWRDGGAFLHAKQTPLVVGYDFAGRVDAVGSGVVGRAVGDQVFGFVPYARSTRQGTLAEQVIVRADHVGARPEGLPVAEAAALATGGCTALQALRDKAGLQAGQRVLVNGASGGVGALAVQIARVLGADVWGICSAAKADAVRALGATHVFDYRETPIAGLAGHPELPKDGFDIVFDVASNSSYGACSPILGQRGVYLTLLPTPSLATGMLAALFSKRRCAFVVVSATPADLEWLAARVVAGELSVPIEASFPLAEAPAALALLASGKAAGKVVVTIGD